MARPNKTPAFWSIDCPFRRKFRVLKVSLERCFGVSLPLPLFPGSPEERFLRLKEFCSAPLERKPHLWDIHLQKSGKRTRFSIWMSLFLFRKVLPSKSPSLDKFMDKISVPSSEPDPLFMEFIRKEVPRMFPRGWDKGYDKQVQLATISTSACAELSRSKGGGRMYWLEKFGEESRSEFISYLKGRKNDLDRVPARLSAVATAGKVRLLSVPSVREQLLLPLHKCIYNRLSRFKWLLRGDAKASRFGDFVRKDGEVFVSGDYESATDNLNQHVQKEILRLILQQCEDVPNEIRLQSMESLSPTLILKSGITGECRVEDVLTGQMMGFPISFPLLCLVNYLSFKFSTMDSSIPVKINGDDIVFRCKPEVAKRWMEQVGIAGLKLSIGKTLVDRSIFTLNSTLFSATISKVIQLPMIRSKALFGTEDGYTSVPGRFLSFAPKFGAERKRRLMSVFLRQNIGFITKSRRSLLRGLQMNIPEDVLKTTRLWSREIAYLSLPKEKPPPPTRSMWEEKPEGYVIEHHPEKKKYSKEERKDLVEAVVSAAWVRPSGEAFEEVYDGGINWVRPNLSRGLRLLKCGYNTWKELLKINNQRIFNDFKSRFVRLYPRWVKTSSNLSSTADDVDNNDNEKVVCRLRGTLYQADNAESQIHLVKPTIEQSVVVYNCGGVGIGPPPLY